MIRTRQHCTTHFCPNLKVPGRSYCAEHLSLAPPPPLPYASMSAALFSAAVGMDGKATWLLALERVKALSPSAKLELWEALAAGAETLTALIEGEEQPRVIDVEAETV